MMWGIRRSETDWKARAQRAEAHVNVVEQHYSRLLDRLSDAGVKYLTLHEETRELKREHAAEVERYQKRIDELIAENERAGVILQQVVLAKPVPDESYQELTVNAFASMLRRWPNVTFLVGSGTE